MNPEQLELWIRNRPESQTSEAQRVLNPKAFNEKEYDRERKAKQRAIGRELYIPAPKNYELRLRCLQDFELLLETYFPSTYDEPFTEDRSAMLASIVHAARYGGDQAIAASRGEGKTTLAMDGAFCLMLAGLSCFPVVIGKNQDSASDELKATRERITSSERFIEDFPEIGIPLEAVGASTANARLQTVGGKYCRMYLGSKYFAFPLITKEQLPHWPKEFESVANGQVMGAIGVKGRVRGTKFRGKRPDLALIDDIEDAQAAASDPTIEKNEKIIEEDVAGLSRSSKRIARVMLCTTQNRKCIAFKYTDPKQKPSWKGKRYRKMKQPPDRMDLVAQYIELRRFRAADDPDARVAFRFWRDNKEDIEAGSVVSNVYSFNRDLHQDGEPLELSTQQAYYNRVADTNANAVATEIDNDPPEEAGPQGNGLTAAVVSSRLNGLSKRQLPANTTALTAAIDLGKYKCHWTVVAWWGGAGGAVVDYGVAEVTGTDKSIDNEASEPMIYKALLNWRDELLSKNYTDATGTVRRIDFVMVDSGTFTNAAYEFCRQVKGIFKPSKGMNPYHPRKQSTATMLAGANLHAQYFRSQDIWLYELDTNYWKQWVHERFLTPTFDETNMLRRGAMSLYQTEGTQNHNSFAHHIAAEELITEFKEGRGTVTKWNPKNENNHWLDATYMAAAAGEVCGVKLIAPSEAEVSPRHVDGNAPKVASEKPSAYQHGTRFRKRPGGGNWIPRRR
jgi:hypothetical protein